MDGARSLKRALSDNDKGLPPELGEVGHEIGRCFIANRFADIHRTAAPVFQQNNELTRFVTRWRDAVAGVAPFTSFAVSNAGNIELAFVPSLEDIPQKQFAGFLEITFANPTQEDAFTIGAVLIAQGGKVLVAALHAR